MLRLHWHPFSLFPRRVRIALREKDLPHEDVEVNLPAGDHRGAAFRRLNPFAQIPVLEDGELVICESVAILEYLEETHPEPPLLSRAPASRAIARQFMLWSGESMSAPWKRWMAPALRPDAPIDADARDAAYDTFADHLDVLEQRLRGRDWLVDDYSLADVCYAPLLTVFDRVGLGELIEARANVAAWVHRLEARPAVRDTAPPMMRPNLPPRRQGA